MRECLQEKVFLARAYFAATVATTTSILATLSLTYIPYVTGKPLNAKTARKNGPWVANDRLTVSKTGFSAQARAHAEPREKRG